jgi:nitroreductase/NAD-dependent dihydropyrimidine dehydrogenase PreA subunit
VTTIIIDNDLCTRCGICSTVCPMGIISSGDDKKLPELPIQAEPFCIRCGHCRVSCPEKALFIRFLPEDEPQMPAGFPPGPDLVGYYLKNRRSVRHYTKKPVPREAIEAILDIARYAPSGANQQPVSWLVIHDPREVHRIAGLTIDWLKHEAISDNPALPGMITQRLIASWEKGRDPICRGAPHLIIASVREGQGSSQIDGIIAATYADAAAPAFGVGTCWAGFLSMAVKAWPPVLKALALPEGYTYCAALMLGFPQYRTYGIPPRNPLKLSWRQ